MVNSNRIKPMLTVKEVARLLHIHPNTVRRWSDQGLIRAYYITPRGDRRFRREDVARFLAEHSVKASNGEKTNSTRK